LTRPPFFPASASLGIAGLIGAIVVLYTGINVQRSPFQALVADLVPSRYRSLATGSVTFQMCVGAIVFLMLGRMLGMRPAFLIAAGTVMAIAAAFALGLKEPPPSGAPSAEVTFRSLIDATWSALRLVVTTLVVLHLVSGVLDLVYMGQTGVNGTLIANTVLRFAVVAVLLVVWWAAHRHHTPGTSR